MVESFLPRLGGMQVIVDSLAAELAARGHDITVVCPGYRGLDGPQPKPGYRIDRRFGSRPASFALGALGLPGLFAKERFDIVHAHNVWPGGLLALPARRAGSKIMVTSHGRDIMTNAEIKYGSRLNPLVAAVIKATLARVDLHTVVGPSMVARALDAGASSDRLEMVPNFLDPEQMASARKVMEQPEAEAEEKYLLMIGRLHAVKGIDLALKVFSRIHREFPGLRIKIAGTGAEGPRLKRLAAGLGIEGSIDWLGQVTGSDKDRLTKAAWAVLVMSRVEGCPLAPIEAMAAGVPVIAPNREPFTDIIDGRNGFLIESGSPESLVKALHDLADPKTAARVTERAAKTAARFTRDAAVDQYESIYYRLAGQNGE